MFRFERLLISLVLVALTGCAPLRTQPGQGPANDSGAAPATQDNGLRMIIPLTGGPPVLGIPVGGDLYVPVTGGAPVPGTPI